MIVTTVPARLVALLHHLPGAPLNQLFVRALQPVLANALTAGKLDFLADKCCAIVVTDLSVPLQISVQSRRLVYSTQTPDVIISADSRAFVQLSARRVDPDTLFFQRRLLITGDTELGLYIKNFLDQFEFDSRFAWIEQGIQKVDALLTAHGS